MAEVSWTVRVRSDRDSKGQSVRDHHGYGSKREAYLAALSMRGAKYSPIYRVDHMYIVTASR